jgi:hypothetical protein
MRSVEGDPLRGTRAIERCGNARGLYSNRGKVGEMVYHLCNIPDDKTLPISVLDAVKMA